ncbi:MAG: endonuclease III domain-containing protein [Spirochaetota bacterium]
MAAPDWERVVHLLRSAAREGSLPSVSQIARTKQSPFRILVSTMISLRTKDEVTLAASERLFSVADTPQTILSLPEQRIAELIYPAGFYRTKARSIRSVARILIDSYRGNVPRSSELLTALPGVGRKTANLVLGLGFGIPAICVDTHVHRIANRCGWVATKTPERTEDELRSSLPERYWIEINELLVAYGQRVCTPASPRCSECAIAWQCDRVGVRQSR